MSVRRVRRRGRRSGGRRRGWILCAALLSAGLALAGWSRMWPWRATEYGLVSMSGKAAREYGSLYPEYLESREIRSMPVFDNRKQGRTSRVKNQGTLGTCWAFASLMALEGKLLPEESYDFSEDNMSGNPNFSLSQDEGGEYTMSMAYLLSWQGPVLEKDDPYGDGVFAEGLKAVKHVQEIQLYPAKDFGKLKEAIYRHGGVQSSLYTSLVNDESLSDYYQRETGGYYYNGNQSPNHDVVLIGWDDHYSRENFTIRPEGDGAFICANSWGDAFGEDGYFYVSYYDTKIGIHNIAYTRVDAPDNYDEIYQSDLCGWVGQLGYGQETAWFSNVYTSKGREEAVAAGFYATGPDTSYEIYAARNLGKVPDLSENNRTLVARGVLEQEGYYTIDFDRPVLLETGERFGIIVKITTPGAVHPVAIEYDAQDGKCIVDLEDGEGYIGLKGSQWDRVETAQVCSLCLKAYTRRIGA